MIKPRLTATGRSAMLVALLTVGLGACTTPLPPHRVQTGTLPSGTEARFTLGADSTPGVAIPAGAVVECLEHLDFHHSEPPAYFAQYTAAIRPAASAVAIGKAAAAPPATARSGSRPRGLRIFYALTVDRLSDGARVYAMEYDAAHLPRRSTPAQRAQTFCSAVAGR